MAAGNKTHPSNDRAGLANVKHYQTFTAGQLADDGTVEFIFSLPFLGKLTDIICSVDVNGTDGTNVVFDLTDDGTSVFSTTAKIAVAAADNSVIRVGTSGTGLTAPVIDSSKAVVAENSKMVLSIASVGTFTVQPENVTVVLEWIEQQDFDQLVG